MNYTNDLTLGLVLLSSTGFVIASYFTLKLAQETKGEKYWKYFLVTALSFGVHEWAVIPFDLHLINYSTAVLISEGAAITAALSLAYASHGLYTSMKRIREKMERPAPVKPRRRRR